MVDLLIVLPCGELGILQDIPWRGDWKEQDTAVHRTVKELLFGMTQHEALDGWNDTAEHLLGDGAVAKLRKVEAFQVVIVDAFLRHPAYEAVHATPGTSTTRKLEIDVPILTWPGNAHIGI